MKKTLTMRTEATSSLNFLIYIQNLFLNQRSVEEELKFPHLSTLLIFHEDFESRFSQLWNEVSSQLAEHPSNDGKLFHKEKELFYRRMFIENDNGLRDYEEIYLSFKTWWRSYAGQFALEKSIEGNGAKVYRELVDLITQKGIEPVKELQVSLIYDDCLLADMEPSQYFSVIPIKDFFIKTQEVISRLEKTIR